ncbi:MAG: type IV pilus biogenesis protein PilP [Alphaproteobacteria bacterium]|nr:type IV pilus biogenesis protein PilP [Alphaproteobacteria bacterium]
MQNKIKMLFGLTLFAITFGCYAEEVIVDANVDDITANEQFSADAVEEYNIDGSLFQQITDLEQEKVLMQLEKERAQLNLDLDRLAAEKIKLHMEIDTLSGRAEQQQQEFETERARLQNEAKRLENEREALTNRAATSVSAYSAPIQQQYVEQTQSKPVAEISKQYKLINVFGAGGQLQATVQDLSNGQNKKLSVGKTLDGYTVKSISLDEGVVFSKDGEIQTLNVTNGN